MIERYRKLPGHRRGILHSASVWIGNGHLLSVRSTRFREEYKRFYLADVQAIAIARVPRFHISTRAVAIGALWTCLRPFYFSLRPYDNAIFWTGWAILIAAWIYVSAACSCRCRIYTAVSRDDLPSVYRTWTARRFQDAVGPLIAEVQGALQGNWVDVLEQKPTEPVREPAPVPQPSAAAQPAPALEPVPLVSEARTATPVAYAFVAALLAQAAFNGLTLRSDSRATFWTVYGLTVLGVIAAIVILVQYHRGLLHRALQRLAIVSLVATGILYYLGQVVAASSAGPSDQIAFVVASRGPAPLVWTGIAADAALGFAGILVLARREGQR